MSPPAGTVFGTGLLWLNAVPVALRVVGFDSLRPVFIPFCVPPVVDVAFHFAVKLELPARIPCHRYPMMDTVSQVAEAAQCAVTVSRFDNSSERLTVEAGQ